MRTRKFFLLAIFIGVFADFLACLPHVEAFDNNAHIALSERATQLSNLNNFLTTNLRFEFPGGIAEPVFNGRQVVQLIQDGAFDEDRPILWRPRHHFHNPRLNWDQAGFRPPPFSTQLGESSVIWSQDQNQSVGGKHSWKDARNTYFQALTATSDSERKMLYAETFRSLGHLIHLVQDAAVPSHTRNDTHLSYKGIGNPDRFHGWAESALGMIAGTTPPPFNTGLLNQSNPNASAPVPVARIIDSTDGDIGLLALSPGLNIGVAEYSSANFFSDDTVNASDFLSPRSSQVEVRAPELDATGTKLRRYVYFRPGFGEQDYPLALASALLPFVFDPLATPTDQALDTKVLTTYGSKLFPRAISYSAGLIDYFIRGRLELFNPEHPFGAACPNSPAAQNQCPIAQITVNGGFRNITPGDTIQGPGEMRAVFRTLEGPGGQQVIHVSDPLSVNLTEQFPEDSSISDVTFYFSNDPFPADITKWPCTTVGGTVPCKMEFVYRGPLGKENDAVIAVAATVDID